MPRLTAILDTLAKVGEYSYEALAVPVLASPDAEDPVPTEPVTEDMAALVPAPLFVRGPRDRHL